MQKPPNFGTRNKGKAFSLTATRGGGFRSSETRTQDAEETRDVGRRLGETLQPGDIVALTGPLGAGKTVFAQGVAESLGIGEPVTSPTFTLISEYEGNMPFYHMDLYRLGTPDEFVWLGVEEMLNGSGVSLVEWSEKAGEELPERAIHVRIEFSNDGGRIIVISRPGGEAA
ncbi:MAG: tRNA (adenosine(37)-N6)-threonylcarbamoyltransferase complex ATPase subunit type 1 TsaE [Spirochaetaceae bacterium]|nr:tRNA (adenosine(37)-N6)-threonylcarbamoyltransferase complex ATPase subunit type 1 TsaE [Spirochaetaceae bacterium]